MIDEPDDDALQASDLVLADGGTWSGLLFDNPRIGLPPRLTWRFTIRFADVERDYGDSPVSLDLEWIELPVIGWQGMAGHTATFDGPDELAEASVYFFQHHRFDAIDLRIAGQDGLWIQAETTLTGDRDRLGIESVTAKARLRFGGIVVHLHDICSAEAALSRLRDFTDTGGLSLASSRTDKSLRFSAGDASSPP